MTTKRKVNLLFYIPLALSLILSAYLGYRNWEKDKVINQKDAELAKWSAEVRKFTDKNGVEHSQIQQKAMSAKQAAAVLGENVSKALGAKDKQIKDVIDINSQIKGEIKTKAEAISYVKAENKAIVEENKVLRDSLYRIKYADKFLDFSGDLNAETKDFTGKYSYSDSLRIVRFIRRTFSREYTFVDVSSNNPNRTVTGMKAIKIGDDRIKRFGLGPAVGYMFNPATGKFDIAGGVVLSYDIIRF